mmetsp:Transcript_35767/g.99990  ORF Transcript_35767/g.99990 Transcript_35767/m.99990 type:complete len:208 (-) Transcript_35767:307-930(-)
MRCPCCCGAREGSDAMPVLLLAGVIPTPRVEYEAVDLEAWAWATWTIEASHCHSDGKIHEEEDEEEAHEGGGDGGGGTGGVLVSPRPRRWSTGAGDGSPPARRAPRRLPFEAVARRAASSSPRTQLLQEMAEAEAEEVRAAERSATASPVRWRRRLATQRLRIIPPERRPEEEVEVVRLTPKAPGGLRELNAGERMLAIESYERSLE